MEQLSSQIDPDSVGMALVVRAARKTFGTEEKAQRWLERPTTALSGKSPAAFASSGSEGAQEVLRLLARIDHGLAV